MRKGGISHRGDGKRTTLNGTVSTPVIEGVRKLYRINTDKPEAIQTLARQSDRQGEYPSSKAR
jgi:hypothetical protein